jgi:dihydroflavonol-4-reductase
MRALVTGADGLLGSHLVRQLLKAGHQVRAFLQPDSPSPTLNDLPIETVRGDLLDEGGAVSEAIRGCELVFHCAAVTNMWAPADLVWKVNVDGAKRIIDGCLEFGVKRLIHTGSASSYRFGTVESPGNETGPFPDQYLGVPYMESKHRAGEILKDAVDNRGLDAVTIAPTFMLGDLDFRPSSGELTLQFIKRQLRYVSPGGRSFAYAKDVAAAMIAAVDRGEKGETYIAGGENLSYLDFFSKVAKVSGLAKPPKGVLPGSVIQLAGIAGSLAERVTGKPVALNRRLAKLALYGTYYDSQKAVRDLGMPQTSVEIGIKDTLDGLKSFDLI